MRIHSSGQARIVYLNAQDAVLYNDPPPLSIHELAIRQEDHSSLNCTYFALSIGHCQTKAVPVERARHSIPKLSDILMGVMKNGALAGELSEGCVYDLVLGIGAPRHA